MQERRSESRITNVSSVVPHQRAGADGWWLYRGSETRCAGHSARSNGHGSATGTGVAGRRAVNRTDLDGASVNCLAQRAAMASPAAVSVSACAPHGDGLRRAYTLIELMVVAVVIGVLLALLLPAVQAAREGGRRLQCQHNLKQISLAMHNYHTTHQSFPYGVNGGWGQSWSTHLLPQVEQVALADLVPWSDLGWWGGPDKNSRALQQLARTRLPLFRCPSQGEPETSDVNQLPGRYVTNYLACAGGNARIDNIGTGGMDRSNGMFLAVVFDAQPRRPTRLADVLDGTSHTLMLSEATFILDGNAGCFTCDRFYLYHPNADSRQGSDFSEALGSTYFPINTKSTREVERECAFSSYHPGGVVAATADGAIHFFSESIDLTLWRAVGSISQAEIAAIP